MESRPESLEMAVETFLAARKRGERIDAATFVERHAEWGADLASAIDALIALERVAVVQPATVDSPERIGPYRVLRELGRGGMGVVHEAIEEPLGRRVALKILPAEFLANASARARFRREAELAARLDHSGIATIFGAGVDDERPWIAMRFVDGVTLADCIAGSRSEGRACVVTPGPRAQDPEIAVARCLAKVARALHAAHEQGVVHRDVKPSNVIVSADGTPVLLDFGLALPQESDGASVTRAGDTAGTPAYFAPEHVAGERARSDARSDVYALGVTLYECLTLRRPFDAPTPVALYRAIAAGDAPSIRSVNRGVSRDLAVVVATAMERDRSRRYADAAALALDLEASASGHPIAARPVPILGRLWRWSRRDPRRAALVALLLVATTSAAVLGGNWWASRDEVHAAELAARQRARDEALAAGFVRLAGDSDAVDDFERARALDPESLEALAGLALADIGRDRTQSALELLASAPKTPGFEALRARALGEPVTQDAACFAPKNVASALDLFLVGVALSGQADHGPKSRQFEDQRRALRMLDEAVVRSPRALLMLHARRAIAAADADDERAARSAVGALLVLWPDSGPALLAAGIALYRFDAAEAEPILVRATELAPSDPAAFQVLGNAYTEMGDPTTAERWLWLALARKPLAETYNSLAKCLALRGCQDEAGIAFEHALALDPSHQNALFNYAQWLYHLERDFTQAEVYLGQFLQLDPGEALARLLLGSCLKMRGDVENARAQWTRCTELSPKLAWTWVELAELEQLGGSKSAARAVLADGLSYSPGDPALLQAIEELGADE